MRRQMRTGSSKVGDQRLRQHPPDCDGVISAFRASNKQACRAVAAGFFRPAETQNPILGLVCTGAAPKSSA